MIDAPPDHAAAQRQAQAARAQLAARILRLGIARMVVVGALILAGIIGYPSWNALACLALAPFAVIAGGLWLDDLESRVRVASRLLDYHRDGLERIAGRWGRSTATGAPEAGAAHPYARDLHVVGERSLFTLIDTSASAGGRALLLRTLLDEEGTPLPGQELEVRWLARQHAWRAGFHAAGLEARREDADQLAAWWAGASVPPSWLAWLMAGVRLLIVALLATAALRWDAQGTVLVFLALVPLTVPLDLLALRWFHGLGDRDALARTIHEERQLGGWLSRLPLDGEAPASLHALVAQAHAAEPALRAGERIAEALAKRGNPLWAYGVGAVLLAEWRNLSRLGRWQASHGETRARALSALVRIDALSCLATYVAEQGGCWPSWSEDGPVLSASALCHPLLERARRVGNSVTIEAHGVLVITGANASGKSTFLRATMLAVVLARCGVTVPAQGLRLRRLRLATVMAVEDDVHAGISRFQAEVLRLKRALDLACSPGLPVLVALDEPLSGTNSVERHLGTAAVAAALSARAAGVMISTHDLALAGLASHQGMAVEVVHFSDHAAENGDGATIAFDYRMRPGVLQTTNALRIMRLAGLPVDERRPAASPAAAAAAAEPASGRQPQPLLPP
jgi:hypothetical protein